MSTLKELDNQIALLTVATNPKTGQRRMDYDLAYRREVFALRVKAEEMRAAEAKTVTLSGDQLAQLNWLDRMTGAKDGEGRQIFFSHDTRGSALRNSISAARQKIERGETLTGQESESIRQIAQSSGATSYPTAEQVHSGQPGLLPPARFNPHPGAQPIITEQNK